MAKKRRNQEPEPEESEFEESEFEEVEPLDELDEESESASPPRLSRFETDLVWILQFLLRRGPESRAISLLTETTPTPPCLSRQAVAIIQSTLARGCVALLARTSGWWKERHLKGEDVVKGRLWERHTTDELKLEFSDYPLRLLMWMTSENVAAPLTSTTSRKKEKKEKRPGWPKPEQDLTPADQLFLYYAFGALKVKDTIKQMAGLPVFQKNALCRLGFPDNFAEAPQPDAADFVIWTQGPGAYYLEGLQAELRDRWIEIEKGKVKIHQWQRMQAVGQSQEHTLNAFFEAIDKGNRIDLARFLFPTMSRLIPENAQPQWWTGQLTSAGTRLQDRTDTYNAALVLPRMMTRLRQWEQRAAGVGYFDDEYAASQLYKQDWERWNGNVLYQRAQTLLDTIEPMRTTN
ncbi:MAG: hypothetical protein ACFCD0_19815 [Gemmataceae bacterium]